MYPVLFSWGHFSLGSYAVMLTLGFAVGMWLAVLRARKCGVDPPTVYSLSLIILVTSIGGAKLFHFFFHYSKYARSGDTFGQLFHFAGGGLMALGGVVFAIGASALYLWFKRKPLWKTMDIIAPSVPLGLSFARLGCFLNGCCFGRTTHSWLGIKFPPHAPVYDVSTGIKAGAAVLPTQLFESAAGLLILGILLLFERYSKKTDGVVLGLMVVLFSTWRFVIEKFRFREADMNAVGGMLSKNQVFSLILIFAGIAFVAWRYMAFERSRLRPCRLASKAATSKSPAKNT